MEQTRLGSIAPGKLATLLVTTGDLFAKKTEVREVWVGGRRFVVTPPADQGLDGSWAWSSGWPGTGAAPTLRIAGNKLTAKVGDAELEVLEPNRDDRTLQCRLRGESLGQVGAFWLRLQRSGDGLVGTLTAPDRARWRCAPPPTAPRPRTARATAEPEGANDKGQGEGRRAVVHAARPRPTADATRWLPAPWRCRSPRVAIAGASLWTSDGRGMLRNGAVHVRGGKIVFAGARSELRQLPADVPVLDATGKHLTPG